MFIKIAFQQPGLNVPSTLRLVFENGCILVAIQQSGSCFPLLWRQNAAYLLYMLATRWPACIWGTDHEWRHLHLGMRVLLRGVSVLIECVLFIHASVAGGIRIYL